jgi:hypothetical protein
MSMQTIASSILASLLAAPLAGAVVAHEKTAPAHLSDDELKAIFLGSRTSWDGGGKVIVAVLSEGPVQAQFLGEMVGKPPTAFATHWKRLVFTGKASMPKQFAKDEDLLDFVAKTEGAIGFVADGKTAPGTTIIQVK